MSVSSHLPTKFVLFQDHSKGQNRGYGIPQIYPKREKNIGGESVGGTENTTRHDTVVLISKEKICIIYSLYLPYNSC